MNYVNSLYQIQLALGKWVRSLNVHLFFMHELVCITLAQRWRKWCGPRWNRGDIVLQLTMCTKKGWKEEEEKKKAVKETRRKWLWSVYLETLGRMLHMKIPSSLFETWISDSTVNRRNWTNKKTYRGNVEGVAGWKIDG